MDFADKEYPSIIIIDGKGDLLNNCLYLSAANKIILDPRYPIALNPFDVPKKNVLEAVNRLEYIFDALLDTKLTPKQTALFRSILRALIIGFDHPTLETFRDIITNGVKKYANEIAKLPQDLQEFFITEFPRDYDATRSELKWRLRLIVENDFLRRMMNAPYTKFNMGKEMDAAKLILINNSQKLLGAEGSEFFGRFFLSQIWQAATDRSDRKGYKRPVHVYIDEAQLVIRRDEMVAKIIDECRSQRIALILAHQRLQQIESTNVLSALSNCAIRISSADDDAKIMAEKLRTEEEHLEALKIGQFACFVRGHTTHAFTMNVALVDWQLYPHINDATLDKVYEDMVALYGYEETTEPTLKDGLGGAQAAAQEKPQASRKPITPSKTTKPEGDPHTGEHTEPAKTWGSKK